MRANIQKTYSATPTDIKQKWFVVDADGQVLGRMASQIASILRGKHKAMFTPSIDTGDFVVVVNIEKMTVTSNRMDTKVYRRYSGYPGGLYETTLREMMAKHPDRALRLAVKRMLPKGALGHQMLGKLKIYTGPEHPHAAQKPEALPMTNSLKK